jgi:hypothetical protein
MIPRSTVCSSTRPLSVAYVLDTRAEQSDKPSQ